MASKIKILYEDSNILVIDKPSGLSVHPDGRTKEKTLVDWILSNYPRMKNVGEPMGDILRPGIVHRLDRDTSGVLVLAKNQKTYEYLKSQFQERLIKKTYHAIVEGWLKDERGLIKRPIGRSPTDFRKYSASRGARGEMREATTQYKVIKRLSLPKKATYLEIYPKTGRTHQIRVHMKAIDHPILCDSLYNHKGICPKDLKRMALHSLSIEFKDPKGNLIKVSSKLPIEFNKVVK